MKLDVCPNLGRPLISQNTALKTDNSYCWLMQEIVREGLRNMALPHQCWYIWMFAPLFHWTSCEAVGIWCIWSSDSHCQTICLQVSTWLDVTSGHLKVLSCQIVHVYGLFMDFLAGRLLTDWFSFSWQPVDSLHIVAKASLWWPRLKSQPELKLDYRKISLFHCFRIPKLIKQKGWKIRKV